MKAAITGIGHFLPEKRITNHDLTKMVDTTDEWIMTRTGIRERRILEKGKGASYMAAGAAQMILDEKQMDPNDLELIIVATTTPDMPVPTTAAFVQKKLKADRCWGFDLNGGCAGFLCALSTAAQFIESGKHKKVMVIGSDMMSSIIDYEDRNTCVIFGDAAGAVLLEQSMDDNAGVVDFHMRLDGEGASYLYVPAGGSRTPASHETVKEKLHFVYQDGRTVFKHAVKYMTEISRQVVERNNLNSKEIGLLIPHQANLRIIDAVARKLDLDSDQVVVNIEKYGNTTAATIPLAMSEAYRENRMAKGDWILLSAFGAGFTWGSILLRWTMD